MRYLLIPAVLGALFLCAYLAACAGGLRWLTLREWLSGWEGGLPRPTRMTTTSKGGAA